MKHLKRSLVVLSFLGFCLFSGFSVFSGCSTGSDPSDLADSFFPMTVGNRWTYIASNIDSFYMQVEITGTEKISGKTYFVFEKSYPGRTVPAITSYYRIDGEGRVVNSPIESSRYYLDFDRPVDENMLPDGCCKVIEAKSQTVDIAAGRFEGCIKIFYNDPNTIDEEFCEYYAPEVGLIKIDCLFGLPMELQSAVVDGASYP